MRASPAEKVNCSMLVIPPYQLPQYTPSLISETISSNVDSPGSMMVLVMRTMGGKR